MGTTICPFIVDLGGNLRPNLPPMIFGILMVTTSMTFVFTPDTKGQPLVRKSICKSWFKLQER